MQPSGRSAVCFKAPPAFAVRGDVMGKSRVREWERLMDSPAQSGERPAARAANVTTVEPLLRPRPRQLEEQSDDRYGLLPPEPPRRSAHPDSVMLALSDIEGMALPRYGSLPGLPDATAHLAQLKTQLNTGLSFVGGYVDAVGFVALVGLFPAHVTGELVSLSAQLSAGATTVEQQATLAILFIAGVATSALLARWLTKTRRNPYILQLGLLAMSLAGFLALGVSSWAVSKEPDWVVATAGAAVFAMGVQNALMRSALAGTLPTTVMTGNLTQLVTELLNALCGRLVREEGDDSVSQSLRRVMTLLRPLSAFFGGAVLGAWLTREVGLVSVALPAASVVSMIYLAIDVERRLAMMLSSR